MLKINQLKQKNQANREKAERLILVFLFILCGMILFSLLSFLHSLSKPSILVSSSSTGEAITEEERNGEIDINKADAALLQTLPGIGPHYSQAIIEYRENHHGFDYLEDIMNVRGIGEKRFESILPYLTISEYKEE